MGGRMVPHLVAAGYEVVAFDPKDDRLEAATAAGAVAAEDARDAVRRGEVVMASLRSSAMFGEVAESDMLPHAVAGQVVLDMGTTEAAETRRLALAFAERGTTLLDSPVSGAPGPHMHVFVGGDREAYARCRPILEATADPERIVYCGPSGTGQAVKAVNQLGMGLVSAAYLEAVAFGIRAGADPKAISQGVGGPEPWRQCIEDVARAAADGRADEILVKFPELPYFLREAEAQGFEAPLTRALFQFLDPCPRDWVDNMGRPRVALWSQLMAAVPVNRP
jgi:3-hydroxyisobutyrate dehydrogenase